MVVDGFARATLTATSCNMLRAHLRVLRSDCTSSHRTRWIVHVSEATTIFTDIGVSTSAVSVVDFGATCAC